MTAQRRHVTARMYNAGFGDAFLVLIPTSWGPRKVLVDCGAIDPDRDRLSEIVERIIEDVTDVDGVPRIDVVIASHRHRDAVSGFSSPAWHNVEVQEVWMPWTEDPNDTRAASVRQDQIRLAQALYDPLADRTGLSDDQHTVRELAHNALSDGLAMDVLHSGFKGHPKRYYLAANPQDDEFRSAALPGVSICVMGPSRESEVVRDMLPPPATMTFALAAGSRQTASPPEPFGSSWWLTPRRYGKRLTAAERASFDDPSGIPDQLIASALDKAINGTSLMIVLKIGRACLLFPGDAQWATWRTAMRKPEWRRLLLKTTLHKIGHHGSHTSTPGEFLDMIIGEKDWCMISTRHLKHWPEIPKMELLKRIRKRTPRMARTDQDHNASRAFFSVKPNVYIQAEIPI